MSSTFVTVCNDIGTNIKQVSTNGLLPCHIFRPPCVSIEMKLDVRLEY